MGYSEMIEITGVIVRETDAAILFDGGTGENIWLPKSQLDIGFVNAGDGVVEIEVPFWLAREKELI